MDRVCSLLRLACGFAPQREVTSVPGTGWWRSRERGGRCHHRLTAPGTPRTVDVPPHRLEAPSCPLPRPPPNPLAPGRWPRAEATAGRLGAGEAAVVITVVAAVTVLAVLQRPIPLVLTLLAGAVGLLLVGRRAGRLLAAVAELAAAAGGGGRG
ncbi:hypothetical protein SAFG77S_12191 [Streptomyces afghaniensis]